MEQCASCGRRGQIRDYVQPAEMQALMNSKAGDEVHLMIVRACCQLCAESIAAGVGRPIDWVLNLEEQLLLRSMGIDPR